MMHFLDRLQVNDPANTRRRVGGLQSHTETRMQQLSIRPSSSSGNVPPFAVFVEKEFDNEIRPPLGSMQGGGSRDIQRIDEDFKVSPNAPPASVNSPPQPY